MEGEAPKGGQWTAAMPQSYTDLEEKLARAQRERDEALEQQRATAEVLRVISSARTRELTESLEYQTATGDILRVISSSPTDVQPVFDTIAANAVRLCGATFSVVIRFDGDLMELASFHKLGDPTGIEALRRAFPRRPGPGGAADRAILTRAIAHIPDSWEDTAYVYRGLAQATGYRSILSVPMLRNGQPIGAVSVAGASPGAFSERQVDLLKTFADQAVIAIENVGLFDEVKARTEELSESLQQQTATADVLKVISRSTFDLQVVLNTLTESVARLCEADMAAITRQKGTVHYWATSYGLPPELSEYLKSIPLELGRGSVVGRTQLEGKTVHVRDVLADPEYTALEFQRRAGFRTVLGVPLLREGSPIGVIVLLRSEVQPFTDKQIELVTTFADQAVIAIENVRLFEDVQTRTRELSQSVEELGALGEVSQAINSTLDVETVLTTIVAKAVQLSGTEAGAIYTFDESLQEFRLRATHGMDEAMIAAIRDRRIGAGETAIGKAAAERAPVQIPDVLKESSLVLEVVVRAGYRAVLIVPLLRPDQIVGALVVRRKASGEFPEGTVELLRTFADQSVLAIQNARLFREIEEKGRELEQASKHKSQFLANMSHELRTPLNAIIGVTEMLREDAEALKQAIEPLDRVLGAGRHLLALINDILDLSKIEAGRMELHLESFAVAPLIDSVVKTVEPMAAKN